MKNIAKSLVVLLVALLFLAGCDNNCITEAVDPVTNEDRLPSIDYNKEEDKSESLENASEEETYIPIYSEGGLTEIESGIVNDTEDIDKEEPETETEQEKETDLPSNKPVVSDNLPEHVEEDKPTLSDSGINDQKEKSDDADDFDMTEKNESSNNPNMFEKEDFSESDAVHDNESKEESNEQDESFVVLPVKIILDGVRVQLADGREGPYINCAWLDGEPLELIDGCAEIQVDRFDVDHVLRVAYISDYGDFQITFADVTTMVAAEPGKDVRISGSIPEITVSVQFVPTLVIE